MTSLKKKSIWKNFSYSSPFQLYIICFIPTNGSTIRCMPFEMTFTVFQATFKPLGIWKNVQHEKVAPFHYLSNGISFPQFWWTIEDLQPKKHRETEWSWDRSAPKLKVCTQCISNTLFSWRRQHARSHRFPKYF